MYVAPTRLWEVGLANVKYDLEERLHEKYIGANLGDDSEIEEAVAVNDNKDNDEKDFQEKNRWLKKKRPHLKQAAAGARAC